MNIHIEMYQYIKVSYIHQKSLYYKDSYNILLHNIALYIYLYIYIYIYIYYVLYMY